MSADDGRLASAQKRRAVKVATLVYVRSGGRTLMLHRVKKAQDMHAGKWNGLGGKLEAGESPEMCAVREVREESGLVVKALEWRGLLTFPSFAQDEDWLAFVYVARIFSGELIDSPEGNLAWIPDAQLLELPLWPGDRIFLPWLEQEAFFSGRFVYKDGALEGWESTFYGPHGEVIRQEASVRAAAAAPAQPDAFVYRYSADEDGYCWLCGGGVTKRHCKITCVECGFMRDCSDP